MFKWFFDEDLYPWLARYKRFGTISSLIILIGFIAYGYLQAKALYIDTDELLPAFLSFNLTAIGAIILSVINQTILMLIINVVSCIHTIKENSNKLVSMNQKPNKSVSNTESGWYCTACGCKNSSSRTICVECGNVKK